MKKPPAAPKGSGLLSCNPYGMKKQQPASVPSTLKLADSLGGATRRQRELVGWLTMDKEELIHATQ